MSIYIYKKKSINCPLFLFMLTQSPNVFGTEVCIISFSLFTLHSLPFLHSPSILQQLFSFLHHHRFHLLSPFAFTLLQSSPTETDENTNSQASFPTRDFCLPFTKHQDIARQPFITAAELNRTAWKYWGGHKSETRGGHVSVCAGKGQETFSTVFIVTGLQMAHRVWLKSRAN